MAFNLKDGFNKFVESNNKLNKKVNEVIGKDVFGELKKIEEPKTFEPYSSFPKYTVQEPAQWSVITGTSKEFPLLNDTISVSAELDTCIQYRKLFVDAANYYTEQFKFKYQNCVSDFDSFVNYFEEMYLEGLGPMVHRAYSLLLSFGVINVDVESFTALHTDNYNKAITSYEIMAGIETTKNKNAQSIGNMVGNSVQMQGGGFGLKGAMKGMAQAEAINIGLSALGKLVENQSRMTQEEKAVAYSKFNIPMFFDEVRDDYFSTYYTLIKTLANNGVITGVEIEANNEFETIIINLQNPMFPQDKFSKTLISLISKYPFEDRCYQLLLNKFGNDNNEVNEIINYFTSNE